MKKIKKKGFTIAELLVVVAIIGILVAVSIPIFNAQLRKARVATNKANIRAARAAAMAQMYTDLEAGKLSADNSHVYYYYDTASGKIDTSQSEYGTTGYDQSKGNEARNIAVKYGVCSFIIVYIAPGKAEKGATIQTAPYYTDKSGDLPGKVGSNPFGPNPGSG